MTPATEQSFQGVVCCCLDANKTFHDTIYSLFKLKKSTYYQNIDSYDLHLKNKYYEANIQLFDYDKLKSIEQFTANQLLANCHAIILYGDGTTLTSSQLDSRLLELEKVQGEPRILICANIDEDCEVYKGLRDWSIKNGYDFILNSEDDMRDQIIDSLSAYKWVHRVNLNTDTTLEKKEELNNELLKKLMDFDTLLNKIGTYRDRPELRGDPNDKNIEEIAEILSGLIGEDVDNFLDGED